MLKTIDILIGATTVLLLFSMAVTVITQVLTNLFQRQGRHLRDGLAVLLQQLGISDEKIAQTIATGVLTHPLIASANGKLGNVIHREEFTKLLLGLSSGQGAATLESSAQSALLEALKQNGISNPGETLKNVRAMALRLEASDPEMANHVRDRLALLQEASSDFLARINSWFDQCIDRVSARFTKYTHAVVVGVSMVVVLLVQLDMIAVVDRLAIDDQFRESVVRAAAKDFLTVSGTGNATPPGTDSSKPAATGAKDPNAGASAGASSPPVADKARAVDPKPYYDLLNKSGLLTLPFDSNWGEQLGDSRKWPGMLIAVLLLSLGAPFWYNALKDLLKLRSAIAGKDDAQRKERQNTQGDKDGSAGGRSVAGPA